MITATLVKKFREETGCGLAQARQALTLTNGDWEMAIQYLKEKGQTVFRSALCPVCNLRYQYDTFLDKSCPRCQRRFLQRITNFKQNENGKRD